MKDFSEYNDDQFEFSMSELWYWYLSNLRAGNFESIANDEIHRGQLRCFLGKKCMDSRNFMVLISVPDTTIDPYSKIECMLTNHGLSRVHESKIQQLNPIPQTDFKNELLFLVAAYDNAIGAENNSSCELIQEPTPRSEYPDDNEVSDTDDDAIVFNFTHQSRSSDNRQSALMSNMYTPIHSEAVSVYSFDCEEDSIMSGLTSLKRMHTPIKEINSDAHMNVVLGKNKDGSIWNAVKQKSSDEWIIYDDKFRLDNLESCTFDELIDANGYNKKILVLFYQITK